MATTLLPGPRPFTSTGRSWSVGRVASPNWPDLLLPHASTVPSFFSARQCDPPAAIAMAPLPGPSPSTCPGAERLSLWPSPSSPEVPFPHAHTDPSVLRTRTCDRPPTSATTPLSFPSPCTPPAHPCSLCPFPPP